MSMISTCDMGPIGEVVRSTYNVNSPLEPAFMWHCPLTLVVNGPPIRREQTLPNIIWGIRSDLGYS